MIALYLQFLLIMTISRSIVSHYLQQFNYCKTKWNYHVTTRECLISGILVLMELLLWSWCFLLCILSSKFVLLNIFQLSTILKNHWAPSHSRQLHQICTCYLTCHVFLKEVQEANEIMIRYNKIESLQEW